MSCQIKRISAYNPIQTNRMPTPQKIKNVAWGFVNSVIFSFTPPI